MLLTQTDKLSLNFSPFSPPGLMRKLILPLRCRERVVVEAIRGCGAVFPAKSAWKSMIPVQKVATQAYSRMSLFTTTE